MKKKKKKKRHEKWLKIVIFLALFLFFSSKQTIDIYSVLHDFYYNGSRYGTQCAQSQL